MRTHGRLEKFWEDCWIGKEEWKNWFIRLYNLYNYYSGLEVADLAVGVDSAMGRSCLDFRRNLNEFVVEELSSLLGVTERVCFPDQMPDYRGWKFLGFVFLQ